MCSSDLWDKSPESKSSPRRVIHRMLGPDMISGAGVVRLFGDDLEAFMAGRLTMAVFGSTGIEPLAEVVVQVN